MNPLSTKVFFVQSQIFSQLFPTKSKVGTSPPQGSKLPSKPTIPKCQSTTKHLGTKPKVTQQWIPKSLLQAQGYYKGNTTIWLPKPNQPLKSYQQPQSLISTIPKKQQKPTPTNTPSRFKTPILATQRVSSKPSTSQVQVAS